MPWSEKQRRSWAPILFGLLALGGASPGIAGAKRSTGDQALETAIGGRRPRPPVDCIDPHWVRSTQIIDGIGIVYDAGDRVFVQRPQTGAASLRSDDVLVMRVEGGQLCRLDTITLVDQATRMQRGFIVLGAFAPYVRTP